MARILLCPPTHHYKTEYPCYLSASDFPTGFAYVAAALKQAGHEVIGANPNNMPGYVSAKFMLQDYLTKKVKEVKPDLIGLGGLATDYTFLRDAINIIRTVNPKIPIVLGGQIVTNDSEFICQNLKPDFAIEGEAEEGICWLASELEKDKKLSPRIIKSQAVKNLDYLPFPDYDLFGIQEMIDKYSMATRLTYRYSRPYPSPFVIVASRSCPFNCSFCIHERREIPYRARSIENIMAEIEYMYERYKFNILIILDELFAVKNERLRDFSNAVLKGKQEHGWDFDWTFQTHACARLDLETLQLAKTAGCVMFSYGLESASEPILKSMNKKTHISQIKEVIDLAEQAKVGFSANLLFGDPAETEDSWAESLAFWLEYGRKNMIFLTSLAPYPGSKVFESFKGKADKNYFYEHIDEGAQNLTAMPDKRVIEILKLNAYLETSWLFVKSASDVKVEQESGIMYSIKAKCPYCGESSHYRNEFEDISQMEFMGTGCQHCHRRIKVNLK